MRPEVRAMASNPAPVCSARPSRPALRTLVLLAVSAGVLAAVTPARAQTPRVDVIWARTTAGAHITLDGVLDEPAWAKAESLVIRYGRENGIPGSGYKLESTTSFSTDSTYAVLKFLVDGNQLYLGATVRDSSIGGSVNFNQFDGLLMALKDHSLGAYPAPPQEYFYSWWYPFDTTLSNQVGIGPCFRGVWAPDTCHVGRSATQIANWDAATKVHGIANSDAAPDTGYTIEMRFNLTPMGYNVAQAAGDIVEWNVSVYDADWYWPNNGRGTANRAWWESPWGNAMWYHEGHIHSRPDVTINSGALPQVPPDLVIPDAGVLSPPAVDGALSDGIWSHVPGFNITWGDTTLRKSYPYTGRWRSGQYQPPVNAHTADVVDPGDATIKMFTKADTLYIGFDVRDQVVQYRPEQDRWDGFSVTLFDRTRRYTDHNLVEWRASFQVAQDGTLLAQEDLPTMRDVLHAARAALTLKPGTTVDTLGQSADQGYQAEMAIDLTKIGYLDGLGDRTLYVGVDLYDGDSFTPFTDSYGTRTWWYAERAYQCCPAWVYMDPNTRITTAVGDEPPATGVALLGSYPNPFSSRTHIRYAIPEWSEVTVDVYDVQGRRVAHHLFGLQPPGTREATIPATGLSTGVYMYRLRIADPMSGAEREVLPGRFMFVK